MRTGVGVVSPSVFSLSFSLPPSSVLDDVTSSLPTAPLIYGRHVVPFQLCHDKSTPFMGNNRGKNKKQLSEFLLTRYCNYLTGLGSLIRSFIICIFSRYHSSAYFQSITMVELLFCVLVITTTFWLSEDLGLLQSILILGK